jgi:hypothetical protein
MGIRPGDRSSRSGEYTEFRVHENPPTTEGSDEQISAEIYAESGDAVEVEFCEQEPLKRVTYVLSLDGHQPNNGVVRVDSPLGRVLLGAAVGDDLQLPDTNDNVIVIGIFKGIDEPRRPSAPTGLSPKPRWPKPALRLISL